jgi:hypothetical protein
MITFAKVLVADNDSASSERALRFLNNFAYYLESIHDKRFLIEVLAIRAMLFDALKNHDASVRDLTRAVAKAIGLGLIRTTDAS